MKKDTLKSVIVLSGICLIVAILLSSVNAVTAPIIEKSAGAAADAAYLEVLPDATDLEDVTGDFPESVKEMKKDLGGSGFAFKLETSSSYSKSPLQMILGIDNEGKILKLVITNYAETKGNKESFEALFEGKDATVTDVVAGVTFSSNAIKKAISEAYDTFYKFADVEKSDEQKLADLYDKLMPEATDKSGAYSFTTVELPSNAPSSITAIYEPKTKIGYIVTAKANNLTVAMAVNAYGKVSAIYDLDGNDLSNDTNYDTAKSDAEGVLPSIYEASNNEILGLMVQKEIISSENEAEKVDFGSVSSGVVAVYKLKNGNAYIANADGYGGTLTVCYVINSKGEIVDYATLKQSEKANEYAHKDYGTVVGFNSYRDRFDGKTVSTLDDETLLVAESTFTTNATKACWKMVLEAHNTMNGEDKK